MRRAGWLALTVSAVACSGSSHPSTPTTSRGATTTSHAATQTSTTTAPHPSSWRALPRAPIAGRIAAGVVWTGHELIVWGGVSGGSMPAPLADGAAFDPATRAWHTIAAPPTNVLGDAAGAAVWTGTSAVFWAGNSPDAPAGGGMYDPAHDTWRRLPDGPLHAREGYTSVWTGKELLIVGGAAGDTGATPIAAAVDPDTGSWRVLRALDVKGLAAQTIWTGHRLLVIGSRALCARPDSTCRRYEPFFASYDPSADALHSIDLANAPAAVRAGAVRSIAWDGTEALFAPNPNSAAGVIMYDPATGRWRTGRPAPCAPPAYYAQSAWLGNRWVEACGADRLQVYTPATDSWRTIAAGASPLNSRAGSAIAWTGNELIAWSGRVFAPGNPSPNSGASIRLER